jgi:cell wall-associated NlpC family hydrolase
LKSALYILFFLATASLFARNEAVNLFPSDSIKEFKLDSLNLTSFKDVLEQQFKKYDHVGYRYGGRNENGFDCSGFVSTVYQNLFELKLPRSSREMLKVGEDIPKSDLQIGDLVIFKPPGYSHVGIYLGDGVFMHSSTKEGVTKSSIDSTYWKKYYKASRRVIKPQE